MAKRKYEDSHPWLKFVLDFSTFDHHIWMLLGEIQSKCDHLAGVPLMPDVAKDLHKLYLLKGALATTAIEGNTLTEEEARGHLDGTLKLPPSREYLGQEIDNVVSGCNEIAEHVLLGTAGELSVEETLHFNAQILHGLTLEDGVVPGAFREHRVVVGRYGCAPPEDCPYLLRRLFDWLNTMDFSAMGQDRDIAFGVIKAIICHVYLVWIHPFGDGNGRTARLLEYKILLLLGIPQPACHLLSNHYNQTRTRYYQELDKTSKSGGDITSFLRYALQGLLDGFKEQLRIVREHQWDTAWVNYVHSQFKGKNTPASTRRRHVVLELSSRPDWSASIQDIPVLSRQLAREYAGMTDKCVTRDINTLVEMKLVRKSGGMVRVCKETILAFLPARRVV
ncbi:MAG: Fic family protein [Desulfomicrobium sp.]|nr:Fic family protein [Desulfomicrobium sp.]